VDKKPLDTPKVLLYNYSHIDEHIAGVKQHEKGNGPMAKQTCGNLVCRCNERDTDATTHTKPTSPMVSGRICKVPCTYSKLSKEELRGLSVYELHEEISALYQHLEEHGMLEGWWLE
jgi:hypothetical protein